MRGALSNSEIEFGHREDHLLLPCQGASRGELRFSRGVPASFLPDSIAAFNFQLLFSLTSVEEERLHARATLLRRVQPNMKCMRRFSIGFDGQSS
jgi:hypothetical protein